MHKKTNSRYSDVVLPDGETFHPRTKEYTFSSMCDFTDKGIKVYKVVMCVKVLQ